MKDNSEPQEDLADETTYSVEEARGLIGGTGTRAGPRPRKPARRNGTGNRVMNLADLLEVQLSILDEDVIVGFRPQTRLPRKYILDLGNGEEIECHHLAPNSESEYWFQLFGSAQVLDALLESKESHRILRLIQEKLSNLSMIQRTKTI